MKKDKLYHLIAGALIYVVMFLAFRWLKLADNHAAGLAYLPVILIGYVKELYDRANPDKHTYDLNDFYATLLGGVMASVPVWVWFVRVLTV